MTAAPHPQPTTRRPATPAAEAISTTTYRDLPELWTRLRRRITPLAAATTLLASSAPALAQQVAPAEPTPYTRAIAAGYKALTLCSGIFNAGRTRAQVEADELRGIYPEYASLVPTLSTQLYPGLQTVAVAWSDQLPPRTAAYQHQRGCVISPIGTPFDPQAFKQGFIGTERRTPTPRDERVEKPDLALLPPVGKAFDAATYGSGSNTVAAVIVRDGVIVAERYAAGWTPSTSNRTWSVAKSIAGTLVGMAKMTPAEPAAVPEWHNPTPDDPRTAITLDQLLRMSSGLHSATAGNRTDAVYFGGTAVTEETVAWPLEVKPGTRFRYANNDILLAVRAMRTTLGEDRYAEFPKTALFDPLGMRHTVAERDWRGNYILSSQVWSTARDLARLGQFWLQDGVWEGKRLLPEGWMRYMTTPSGPQPATGPGYGATMWLFGPAQGLPAGSYAAQGNRGQFVMVVPSKKLVIVRRGEDPGTARFDIARFTADVIAATP